MINIKLFNFLHPYRNQKRNVSIWILKQLLVPKITVVGTTNPDIEINTRTYSDYTFNELIEKGKYDRVLLRDAIEMLYKNEHLGFRMENSKNIYDCTIYTNFNGESAIKDEYYEDEIEIYNNDKYYRYLRWWLPILSLVISVISICLSTCKK